MTMESVELSRRVANAVARAVDAFNAEAPDGVHLTDNPETVLFGLGGSLDSLGLVNFIVAVEQQLEQELALTLTLADERAMARDESPFATLGALTAYAESLAREAEHG